MRGAGAFSDRHWVWPSAGLARTVACRPMAFSPASETATRSHGEPPASGCFRVCDREETSMARLTGKVAFITGAGNGIGRATAILFAREGAKVAIVEIDARAGDETAHLAGSYRDLCRRDRPRQPTGGDPCHCR